MAYGNKSSFRSHMSRKHKDVVVSKLEETTSAEGEILEEEEVENVPKSKDGKGVKRSKKTSE